MVEKKQKKNRRESSFRWAHQFLRKHEKHSDVLIKKFEMSYPKLAVADPEETPVNILCLDGGGMRGTLWLSKRCSNNSTFCNAIYIQYDVK